MRCRRTLAATLLVGLAAAAAPAQADPLAAVARAPEAIAAAALTQERTGSHWSPELSASRTRLTPPGPPAVGTDGRPLDELAGVQARLWLSRGRTAVGVGVGTLGYVHGTSTLQPADGPVTLTGAAPTVSVGMRYRMTRDSAVFADALGARALAPDTGGSYLNTKVGMEWKPATSRFGFDHGALGIHFDSGYRLSVKARHDGVRVYLRGQF